MSPQTQYPKSKPESFVPPYEANTSIFPEGWTDYVLGLFGVQTLPGANGRALEQALDDALTLEPKPLHIEQVRETDADGYVNAIRMAYWRQAEDYYAWRALPAVRAVLEQPLSGGIGLWREVMCAPADNVDPTGFLPRHTWGVGRHVKQVWERYHAYYGSMRDRIPNGRSPEIEGTDPPLTAQTNVESFGRRLKVETPHNICFVRGIFGWRNARQEEQDIFLQEMLPVYHRGAMFLRDNPEEALCISTRHGPAVDTEPVTGLDLETLMWFTSIKSLEQWTHHHPTHAAIFRKAHQIGMQFEFKLTLDFGHEVVVVPKGGVDAEYNNCHPRTGFLRFYPAQPA